MLSIVECLKEFKGMLWGNKIKVYTDHQNLFQSGLGQASDRVLRWRLILEEFGPEIVYIKGIDNIVADAISRLEYTLPTKEEVKDLKYTERFCYFTRLLNRYTESATAFIHTLPLFDEFVRDCFVLRSLSHEEEDSEDEIYPVTLTEIADAQRKDDELKHVFEGTRREIHYSRKYSIADFDGDEVVVYRRVKDDNLLGKPRVVIPEELQQRIMSWYHHYLMHPGALRLYETLAATMYWKHMEEHCSHHVKYCKRCQLAKSRKHKHGKLPPKEAETIPWRCVCVDLIGPYTLKGKDGSIVDFMCLTMIDPATGWFELIELPTKSVTVKRKRKKGEIETIIIDKSSAQVSRLFNKQWLSRYPRSKYVIFDNGSEFKLHFKELCESFQIEHKPTTVLNPQANAILERMHGVLGNMMRTAGLDMSETVTEDMIDDFLTNTAWAIRSTYHTVLRSSPGAAIFGRDMLFDIPYLADWTEIGRQRQALVDRDNAYENKRRKEHDYNVGDKCNL